MTKQIIFALALILTFAVFGYTVSRFVARFKLTKKAFPVRNISKRFVLALKIAFAQTKILRRPVIGLMHALVFWGFCVIIFGSLEMVFDGLTGGDRSFRLLGIVYKVIIASGDIFAILILIIILAFLGRRTIINVRRFHGTELKRKNHIDAAVALSLIFLLMLSLLGINAFYYRINELAGTSVGWLFRVSRSFSSLIGSLAPAQLRTGHEFFWWSHILLIFIFANYLPYSKHFHVFLSIPNVFLSNLNPLGKLKTMEHVTAEVKLMMDPQTAFAAPAADAQAVPRFGILDAEDITWKNYLDSLSCTQCGRCTSVCPANLTGKKLSPRKVVMDVRARMREKSPGLIREGAGYSDNKSLLRDYVTAEELWACTTCNACAQECPININQPSMIVDMRRYLVMEESAAPAELNSVFSNIENNGAPWQFSMQDRMKWAEGFDLKVPLMSELATAGRKPEYLLWVGSAGAFDDRYKQVTRAFVKILNHLKIDFAVLGTEESSSGDVARRAGNEMLFQMQALMNIELLKGYGVTKILTCDPHAYNTFKNEYPDLGGSFEVTHHSQFLSSLIASGMLKPDPGVFHGQVITFHDPCYLGRANKEYAAPRSVVGSLSATFREMSRHKSFALCCGAGGGQMFKEAEQGDREVFMERTDDALETGADIIATACPYCLVMMTDGIKYNNKEEKIKVFDLAELIAKSMNL
ncbi:MAG: heterodisulfide reductase-related iron-sulfur binding cluster [Bacteroidota bacterium]